MLDMEECVDIGQWVQQIKLPVIPSQCFFLIAPDDV